MPSAASASIAGVAPGRAPYAAGRSARKPSIEIRTIGPWCGGDSRANRQPVNAAPATASVKSATMSVTCHRFRAAGVRFTMWYSEGLAPRLFPDLLKVCGGFGGRGALRVRGHHVLECLRRGVRVARGDLCDAELDPRTRVRLV